MSEENSEQPRSKQLWRVLAWPGCAAMLSVHLFKGDDFFTLSSLLIAGSIGCLAVVSTAYLRPRVLPGVQILLAYFYVAMARPTFDTPFIKGVAGPIYLLSQSYHLALVGCLVFALSLVAGNAISHGMGRRFGRWAAPRLDPPAPYGPAHTMMSRICAAVALLFYVFVQLRPTLIPPTIAFAVSLFSSPAIPLGLLFWDVTKTDSFWSPVLFWGAVGFCVTLGLSSGAIGAGVLPGLIAAALVWTVRGRIPVALVAVMVLVVLVLNPAKHRYRTLTWYQERDVGLAERAEGWMEAIAYTYSGGTDAAIDASVETTSHRTSTLPAVALVMEYVPMGIPYAGPQRWLELPLMFVPRALWPAKPSHTESFNNDFTLTFGLQTPRGVETTTLNLPSVADGFWRLGWAGVVLEGLLLGLSIGFFSGACVAGSRGLLIMGVGFIVSTQADKHVFQLLASIPQYVFATATILVLVRSATIWLTAQMSSPQEQLNRVPTPQT